MTIKIEGMDKVIKKLESLNKPAVFKAPMQKSLNHLERRLKQRVMKSPGAFTRHATRKQRIAYWIKVKKDPSLHGPGGYQRTNTTARGWTTRITKGGREGWIGNIKPGAPYVYGDPKDRPYAQQPFHAESGWPRVDLVAKKEAKAIVRFFQQAYEKALK